jgi:hypothetical protein
MKTVAVAMLAEGGVSAKRTDATNSKLTGPYFCDLPTCRFFDDNWRAGVTGERVG